MSLIGSANAAYVDGKSHDGDCVGFNGCNWLPDSYCVISSDKQTIVATSSCEAELVNANKGARNLVWGQYPIGIIIVKLYGNYGHRDGASSLGYCSSKALCPIDYLPASMQDAIAVMPIVSDDNQSPTVVRQHTDHPIAHSTLLGS